MSKGVSTAAFSLLATSFAARVSAMRQTLSALADRSARASQIARELQAYSDRELTDLGIARADIRRIAATAGE